MNHTKLERVVKWTNITFNIAAVGVLVAGLLGLDPIAQSFEGEGVPWLYYFLVVGSLFSGTFLSIVRQNFYWLVIPIVLLFLPMPLS